MPESQLLCAAQYLSRRALVALTVAMILIVACATSCGDDPADPASQEQILLDRAVKAVWGDTDPASVTSIRQKVRSVRPCGKSSVAFELNLLVAGEKRYREERVTPFGIHEVFAMNGEESWAMVDGTVVPLSEAEIETRRLQPWLVQISKIAPLRDTEKFDLEHLGKVKLEDGQEVERLEVESDDVSGLTLTFDFDVETHLPRRVVLKRSQSREEHVLELADYREVQGVRIAHEIRALRDGVLHATQTLDLVELNVKPADSEFARPLDLNRDSIAKKALGLSGPVAYCPLEGDADDPDDLFDTATKLKAWIAEQKLVIVGPLALLRGAGEPRAPGEERSDLVAIVIGRPEAEFKPTEDEPFGTMMLPARAALCLTHVGEEPSAGLIEKLRVAARTRELETEPGVREIFFSADGATRQLQLPVR